MSGSARIDDLQQKYDDNPSRYFAALANEHRKVGDLDRAIALCQEQLEAQPAHLSGHVVLAKALFARGDREGARGSFERALSVDPENVDALRQLALLARDGGEGFVALEYTQRALAVDPMDPELLAIASDLSAPPDEDVAPPSFDPRSMFDDFVPPAPVQSVNPLSRSQAVDELMRGLPGEGVGPEEETAAEELPPSVPVKEFEREESSAADPVSPDQVMDSGPEMDSDTDAEEPSDVPQEQSAAAPDLPAEEFEQTPSASVPPADPVAEQFQEAPSPDDLPEITDSMIGDWPTTIEATDEAADTDESAEIVAEEAADSFVREAAAGASEEAAEFAEAGAAEEQETDGQLVETVGAVEQTDAETEPVIAGSSEEPAAPPAPEVTPPSDAGVTPAELETPEPVAEPTPAAPTSGRVDWPDLGWPSDVEQPATLDSAMQLPEEIVPRQHTPVSAASAQDLPEDPPLALLPEEAEVPAGARVAFATETMAEILVEQGRHDEALRLYQQLVTERPNDESIRSRMEALYPETVVSDAPPMRELLSRILAYTPPASSHRITPPPMAPEAQESGIPIVELPADGPEAGYAEAASATERAARNFADAGAAMGDPGLAGALADAAKAQPEPISSVLAGLAPERGTTGPPVARNRRITPRGGPTFSFDQFFREALPDESLSEDQSTPGSADAEAVSADAELRSEEDDDDFRAWLDGLRKS